MEIVYRWANKLLIDSLNCVIGGKTVTSYFKHIFGWKRHLFLCRKKKRKWLENASENDWSEPNDGDAYSTDNNHYIDLLDALAIVSQCISSFLDTNFIFAANFHYKSPRRDRDVMEAASSLWTMHWNHNCFLNSMFCDFFISIFTAFLI